jgi:hypothetical protein
MAQKKYQKFLFPNPLIAGTDVKHRIVMQGSKHNLGGLFENYWLRWNCIKKPVIMAKPHTHDFDEIFHFFGSNPEDISDFHAVVDITLGPELEIYTITTPTILYVPKGLVHAPFNVKVVDKPIIFMNVANAPEYVEIPYKVK